MNDLVKWLGDVALGVIVGILILAASAIAFADVVFL